MTERLSPLLIANRGEIACRIIRTCRRLGIATVAVFSDADRDARHVAVADAAVPIGPSPPGDSYLCVEAVLDAARRTGARAVHPGYGFLAESAAFARACAEAGLVFVGPSPEAMERLGDKDAAKATAEAAGVPTVPGHRGEQDAAALAAAADQLGYPLLVKAVAGGGGRGMRRVDAAAEFTQALAAAQGEALTAFGRSEVLLERLILRPRHIEVQVVVGADGRAVHLFERDCTLQRRHQKILEEAPAPGLDPALRDALGRAAVTLATAAGYRNAGTVEFLLEPGGAFHFIEMNTRLQVEHPVTETVTGVDLVEWQLLVAAGCPVPRVQDDIRLFGHAIEARICAEDPARGFLPSAGRLERWRLPGTPDSGILRLETGYREGDLVPPFYDSMIAKLILWGADRDDALTRLGRALGEAEIAGPATNLGLLRALCADPAVRAPALDTTWLDRNLARLAPLEPAAPTQDLLAAATLAVLLEREAAVPPDASPWERAEGWRLNAPAHRVVRFAEPAVAVDAYGPTTALTLRIGEATMALAGGRTAEGAWIERDGVRHPLSWQRDGSWVLLAGPDGQTARLRVEEPGAAALEEAASDGRVTASLPGRIARVAVSVGAVVARGDLLVVLEAMKMEHAITAPVAGRVTQLNTAPGDRIDEGTLLVVIEPTPAGEASAPEEAPSQPGSS